MNGRLLRSEVIIQQRTAGSPQKTATGAPSESWTTYATVRASIEPVIGREFFAAEQMQSKVDTKIRLRYQAGLTDGITAAMRISHDSKIYNIEGCVNVRNMNREWLLYCSTGANQG